MNWTIRYKICGFILRYRKINRIGLLVKQVWQSIRAIKAA
jgi:hypothetical protein